VASDGQAGCAANTRGSAVKALHAKINVKFLGGEGGGHRGEQNRCQTEYGDLWGPTLFNFHVLQEC
jgi:hypothetical protein